MGKDGFEPMSTPGLDKAIAGLRRAKAAVTRATRYAIMKEARRQGLTRVELRAGGDAICWRGREIVRCEEIHELCERHFAEIGGFDLHNWRWSIDQSWRNEWGERP